MSTHLQGFQSFSGFLINFVLAELVTSSIRVKLNSIAGNPAGADISYHKRAQMSYFNVILPCFYQAGQLCHITVEHTYDTCPKYSELGSFRIIAYLYVSDDSPR